MKIIDLQKSIVLRNPSGSVNSSVSQIPKSASRTQVVSSLDRSN